MQRLLFAVILLASVPLGATAAEYKSSFGFTFKLSGDWLVMTPAEVSKEYEGKTLESMDLGGVDQTMAAEILEKVKTGEVEYYFDKSSFGSEFTNNISTLLMGGGQIPTPESVKALCPTAKSELENVYHEPVKMTYCRYAKANGVPYLAFEYLLTKTKMTVVQREVPYLPNAKLVVVGAAKGSGLDTVRKTTDSIAMDVTKYVAGNWHVRVPGKKEQVALVKGAMHDFALAVQAKDFTDYHRNSSRAWQRVETAEELTQDFKSLMENEVELLPLDQLTPRVEVVKQRSKKAILVLKGDYPTDPRVTFEFTYLREGKQWKISGTHVYLKTVK